jgi:hypothetical protein
MNEKENVMKERIQYVIFIVLNGNTIRDRDGK